MPIRWRLTLLNAGIIGAILLLLCLSLYLLLRGALTSSLQDTVQNRAVATSRSLDAGELLDDEEESTADGVFVLVRDADGRILDTTSNVSPTGDSSDGVWRRALETGRATGGRASLSTGAPDYVYAVPVDGPGASTRIVEAGESYDAVGDTLQTFATVLAAGGLLAFVLSVLGAYLLARAALRPVEAVVRSAREVTASDLSRRLPVAHQRDEIGRLATTINGLLARLEAAFARREEALARQRRFAADASHELRTPLTSIAGYARMLESWGLRDPEASREAVDAIRRESERMLGLVEALLALTRGDEGAPLEITPHDLAAVAEEASLTARTAAGGKVSVTYRPPGREVRARFDRHLVRQAASILLDNAVKYTPEGGSVEVEVRERDGWAELEVTDTGVGIPEDGLPLIFERFHRADASRTAGGTGLGLAIARQVAEAHGGGIRVRSTEGAGSTFTLRLPGDSAGSTPDHETLLDGTWRPPPGL